MVYFEKIGSGLYADEVFDYSEPSESFFFDSGDVEEFIDGLKASGRSLLYLGCLERRLQRLLEYTGGRLSRESVRSFFLSLECSPKTRLHYYRCVKQFLGYLGLERLVDGLKPPRVPRRGPPVVPADDVLADLGKLRFRERVEVLLLTFTGLRPWEAHRLTQKDIDLESVGSGLELMWRRTGRNATPSSLGISPDPPWKALSEPPSIYRRLSTDDRQKWKIEGLQR